MRVLIVGATGMLGRVVARRLGREAGIETIALARDEARARRILGEGQRMALGDVRDARSLLSAMRGVDAVYVSLNTAFSRRAAFDPDRDGTANVVEAAARAGAKRIVRLSALEVKEAEAIGWWVLERKREADERVMASQLEWTIFRPDWFMETLRRFRVGPVVVAPKAAATPIRWIAGADYAEQVARSLAQAEAAGRIFPVQGPEAATLGEAVKRFARAMGWRAPIVTPPRWAMRFGGVFSAQAGYGAELLEKTLGRDRPFRAEETWRLLGEPTMTIEAFAQRGARQ